MRAFVLFSLIVLTGCAQVTLDLTAAQKRAHDAVDQKLLPATDPMPACLDYFVGTTQSLTATGSAIKPPFAGIVDFGVEGYILDSLFQNSASSDALDKACAPVALKILKNAGRRAPGVL